MKTSNQVHHEQYENYRDEWADDLQDLLHLSLAGTPQDPMLQDLSIQVHSGVQDAALGVEFIACFGSAILENVKYLFAAMSTSSTPLRAVTTVRIEIFVGNEPFEPQHRTSYDDYAEGNMLSVFNDTVVSFLVDTIVTA